MLYGQNIWFIKPTMLLCIRLFIIISHHFFVEFVYQFIPPKKPQFLFASNQCIKIFMNIKFWPLSNCVNFKTTLYIRKSETCKLIVRIFLKYSRSFKIIAQKVIGIQLLCKFVFNSAIIYISSKLLCVIFFKE